MRFLWLFLSKDLDIQICFYFFGSNVFFFVSLMYYLLYEPLQTFSQSPNDCCE